MKFFRSAVLCVSVIVASIAYGQRVNTNSNNSQVKTSIFPPNNMRISANTEEITNITEQMFNDAAQATKEVLAPMAKENNETLDMQPDWNDDTVNAAMSRYNGTLSIFSYGGLARHKLMTYEAFVLVAGHEGSHAFCWKFNKKPVYIQPSAKICAESLADYNGSGDLVTPILKNLMSKGYVFSLQTDTYIENKCADKWNRDTEDYKLCVIRLNAGNVLATILAELNGDPIPNYGQRDTTVVKKTNVSYPSTQCRLDQYFDGVFHITPYSKCWFYK